MNVENELRLFPYQYKKYFIIVMAIAFIIVIFDGFGVLTDHDFLGQIVMNVLLVCLLALSLSRDKEEDELTMKLRLKAIASTFILGVSLVIVDPYINLLFDGDFRITKEADGLLLTMMIYYFFIFYSLKKRR